MKFKYKNWLAALAATSILAFGAVGMADATITKDTDGKLTATTDTDVTRLNRLTGYLYGSTTGSGSVAFMYNAKASGMYSVAIGLDTVASGSRSAAFADSSKAYGDGSTAIAGGVAYMHSSVAIGGGATTGTEETDPEEQLPSGAIAIGRWSKSTNYNSTAIGSYAKAYGSEASSFGAYAIARGKLSTAVGYYSVANAEYSMAIAGGVANAVDSVAIGWDAETTKADGVALGSYAIADRDKFGDDYDVKNTYGYDAKVSSERTVWAASAAAIAVGGVKDLYDDDDNYIGSETITRQITGVAAGTQLTDAVNVAQLQAVKTALENKIDNIQLTISGSDGNIKVNDKASDTKKVGDAETGTTGGTGESTKKGMEFDLTLADEITVDKVTAGDTTITTDGVTVGDTASLTKTALTVGDSVLKSDSLKVNGKEYITSAGINANDQKITGVADGSVAEGSKDAVNGGQLYTEQEERKAADDALSDRITQNSNAIAKNAANINKLGNRIDRVGAGAAALAALHPLDFDPDAKWDFAAGYGNYRGANAAAVGAFYRPNEDLMFSVGGSFGGGENMVNAGVSVKLGSGSDAPSSKAAMAAEIRGLRGTVAAQDEKLAAQDAQLAAQDARLAAQDEKIAELTRLVEQLAAKG